MAAESKTVAVPGVRSLRNPQMLRELVENLKEGIYIVTAEGEFLDANPALLDLLGVGSMEELRQHRASDFFEPEMAHWKRRVLEREGAIRDFEVKIRQPLGDIRTVLDTAYARRNPDTGELIYHGILVDITQRKELENQLREQSIRDPLTGCFNRRFLSMFERASDPLPGTWGCIVIDVDDFKRYNDEFGHQAGDDALLKLARFLMRQIRAEEAVIRMGGDEFLILLTNADSAHSRAAAKRIESAAAIEAPVAFSMGWGSRRRNEKLEKTMGRADKNMYAVKTVRRAPERDRRRKPQNHKAR